MKVAVIGANGQLGSDVVRAFEARGDQVCQLTHADVELANADSVAECLRFLRPAIVVNTAAMHDVENCEQQPEKAYAVNALGARNVALATRDLDVPVVQISTDYVFDGHKGEPYVEEDVPMPVNVYGNTKLAGEHFVRSVNPKHFVLRTSALYGMRPCRGKSAHNFVELMLRLAQDRGKVRVLQSEVVTPTPTAQLANQIVALSRRDAYGLYHATAEGSCSWYEFAREIFEITNTKVQLEVAEPAEFPAKVARPSYSVLENQALKMQGLNRFGPWQQGLREYLGMRRAAILPVPA